MSYPIGTILIDYEQGDEWIKVTKHEYRCTKPGKAWMVGQMSAVSESYAYWTVITPKESLFDKLYLKLKK